MNQSNELSNVLIINEKLIESHENIVLKID